MYHPDIKADKLSHSQFNKLQDSYERLKVYIEMRDKLREMENNVDENGTIIIESSTFNIEEKYQQDKSEVIQRLRKLNLM